MQYTITWRQRDDEYTRTVEAETANGALELATRSVHGASYKRGNAPLHGTIDDRFAAVLDVRDQDGRDCIGEIGQGQPHAGPAPR